MHWSSKLKARCKPGEEKKIRLGREHVLQTKDTHHFGVQNSYLNDSTFKVSLERESGSGQTVSPQI